MTALSASDYEGRDGLELARLVAQKEASPWELMQSAIGAARSHADLNALVYPQFEESLALARHWQPRGVFQGIPFLLKDVIPARRFPLSLGTPLLAGSASVKDATLVERFEQAGLLAFARTRVPGFCMSPSTESVLDGTRTLNPWDRSRSAGGSSGGAAAAVAARIVPVAHGNDGGGSIRIPAACCGVFGLKPSRGRTPVGPMRGEGWGGMSCEGVLSRSVRDTAAALDAVSGYEPGAPYAAPPQMSRYLDAIAPSSDKPLRIGVWREAFVGIPISAEPLAALDHTVKLCQQLRHQVFELPLPTIDFDAFVRSHGIILATNIAARVNLQLSALGRGLADEDIEPVLRDGYDIGQGLSAAQYLAAIQHLHAIGHAMHAAFEDCDLVLTPALTRLPVPAGEFAMNGSFWDFRTRTSRYATFLPIVNASGQPAAVIPLTWTEHGLPVSTQIIGRFGREDLVLRLSAQLEEAAPWAHRKPPASADFSSGGGVLVTKS